MSHFPMHHIAFVCIDNCCLSQMAEGWLNSFRRANIQGYSAGILLKPMHLNTLEIMNEKHIDIAHHTTKSLFTIPLKGLTHIITIGDKAREVCPPSIPHITYFHWNISDPCQRSGSDHETLPEFRRVRDQVGDSIRTLLTILP